MGKQVDRQVDGPVGGQGGHLPSVQPSTTEKTLEQRLSHRELPNYLGKPTWQMQWEEDSTRDEIHQVCAELFTHGTSAARLHFLHKHLKDLVDDQALFQFPGHVQTYGIGSVGSIGELAVPMTAQGNFMAYRGKRFRIVQHGSGSFTREFSVLPLKA